MTKSTAKPKPVAVKKVVPKRKTSTKEVAKKVVVKVYMKSYSKETREKVGA